MKMSDSEIIDQLTSIRGIGRWSVEMLLIFDLGRLDVLPINDFGLRRGFALTYGMKKLPSPLHVTRHGIHWKPYRSIASWYLWRAVDLKGEKKN